MVIFITKNYRMDIVTELLHIIFVKDLWLYLTDES